MSFDDTASPQWAQNGHHRDIKSGDILICWADWLSKYEIYIADATSSKMITKATPHKSQRLAFLVVNVEVEFRTKKSTTLLTNLGRLRFHFGEQSDTVLLTQNNERRLDMEETAVREWMNSVKIGDKLSIKRVVYNRSSETLSKSIFGENKKSLERANEENKDEIFAMYGANMSPEEKQKLIEEYDRDTARLVSSLTNVDIVILSALSG